MRCFPACYISHGVGNKLIFPTRKNHKDFVGKPSGAEMERARSRYKQRGEIEVEGKNEKKNKEKKGGKDVMD